MGKTGLKLLAEQNLAKAHYAATRLRAIPGAATPFNGPWFNEFVIEVPGDAERLLEELRHEKIIGGLPLGHFYPELNNHLLICLTEVVSKVATDRMVEVCRKFAESPGLAALTPQAASLPAGRKSR
jgi:glycine dehydrogenase subunit 1